MNRTFILACLSTLGMLLPIAGASENTINMLESEQAVLTLNDDSGSDANNVRIIVNRITSDGVFVAEADFVSYDVDNDCRNTPNILGFDMECAWFDTPADTIIFSIIAAPVGAGISNGRWSISFLWRDVANLTIANDYLGLNSISSSAFFAGSNDFSTFTTDCHGTGTNLCLNGHTPSILDNELWRFAAIALLLLVLIWASFQESIQMTFGSAILSVSMMIILLFNQDMLTTPNMSIVMAILFILPMGFGGYNFNRVRAPSTES